MDKVKETKAFYELKKRMEGHMEKELFEDDNIFYRFLRARHFKVDLAEDMLKKHLEWRKQNDIKNILEFNSPEVLERYLPGNIVGYTKDGEVLRYYPTGNLDIRGILDSCSEEVVMKHLIKKYEEDLAALKEQSKKVGKHVDKVVFINDLKAVTLGKVLDKKVLRFTMSLSKMYEDNYPECLKCVFVTNAPSFVGIMFSLAKTFIPKQILEKIKVYTDDSWKEDLLEIVDAEILPAFLGGKRTDPDGNPLCNTFISHAGTVPEEYYIKKSQFFTSLPDVQKITIPRAAVHEMPLKVKETDAFLEWEFKVKSGDIKFRIKYQNDEEDESEIVPPQRITTDEYTKTGCHKCENVGTYVIVFDNSHSFLRSKDVYYKIQVISPEKELRCFEE